MLKKCKVCGKESYMNFWEDTCCACSHRQYLDEIKQDILSDEKTDTSCEDEVICPWCGEVQKYDADIPEIYQDGYHEMQCHDCEKHFSLYTNVSYYYDTERIGVDENGRF